VEGEPHQFLIDSGASLSLVKPGVSLVVIKPMDLAARGITGTKLKSLGTQEIEIELGRRVYAHEFLVTPLDVEYSGVLRLDILRQMEAKVSLCSGGLIIGRRRYELTGLDCKDLIIGRRRYELTGLDCKDLIIGRRRYELTGLDCKDRELSQVTVTQPVAENEWNGAGLINLTGSTLNESATGKVGAGGLASRNCGDLNPDCPVAQKLT